jgi:hypothetical protein
MEMRKAAALAVLLVFGASFLFAQAQGGLAGTVVDPTGAVVSGAKVQLFIAGGKTAILSVETSPTGEFTIPSLRPTIYDLRVENTGFTAAVVSGVVVDPARTTNVPTIQLELAASTASVDVTAAAQAVEVTNDQVSTTVTQAQIANLPVLDRQVNNLFLTQPGVSLGKGPVTVDGLRTSLTNLTLDGVNIQDNFIRTNSLDFLPNKLTIGQVSEFTVTTSNQDTTLGLGASQVSLTTPSGTNELHGGVYWFNRNSVAAANDWFNNQSGVAKPHLNLNQLGGDIGGPIIKDRLFFFLHYEAYRLRTQVLNTNTVLTANALQGILSYPDANGNIQHFNILQAQSLAADPGMQALINATPLPNSTLVGDGLNTGGYSYNAAANEDRDNVTGRIDYYLSPKHIFSGSYLFNRDTVDRPDIGNFYTVTPPITNNDHSKLLSASWRWTPKPTLTNELRGGFNFSPGTFDSSGKLPPYLIEPNVGSGTFFDLDPLIFTPPVNTFLPQGRATNTWNLQDNATYTRGKHVITFGFQAQWINTAPYDFGGTVPDYGIGLSSNSPFGFSPGTIPGANSQFTTTANDLLAALGGLIADDTQTFNVKSRTSGFVNGAPNLRHYTYNTYSGYVSDNWRLLRRLSLTLGLRYDYYTVLNEKDSLALLPELINNNVITTMLSNATLNFAGNSVGRPFYHPDYKNFAPHVGFAWDVFGDGKTAVRGGYSIAYVNDDTISTLVNNISTTNGGLAGTSGATGLTNTLSGGLPSITVPTFQVPRTFADNYNLNPSGNAQGMPEPNLRTPYVQQWSIGIQHETKGFILEGRYVGNHAVKGLRAIDYNQIVIGPNGFLDDYKRARSNGFLEQAAGNGFDPSCATPVAGCQALTLFPQLVAGGLLNLPIIQTYIQDGEVGGLAALYQQNGLNGSVNFFNNPNTNGANVVTNLSSTTYNALQLDVRRRTASGLQFQFNYTFSRALGNSGGDGQERFEPFLDNATPSAERARLPFDLTHVFHSNFYFPLPVGPGHRFNFAPLGRFLSGWGISSFITYQSGTNFSILSSLATVNRFGLRSNLNTVDTNLTKSQLDNVVGFFMTGNGPMFVSPSAINSSGFGVAPFGEPAFPGQVFTNPGPGELGSLQRRYFNGPWDFNWDFAVLKTTKITERQSLEFRAEFFNFTNHPAFTAGDEGNSIANFDVNSATFGKITQTVFYNSPSRLIQFGLQYRF